MWICSALAPEQSLFLLAALGVTWETEQVIAFHLPGKMGQGLTLKTVLDFKMEKNGGRKSNMFVGL